MLDKKKIILTVLIVLGIYLFICSLTGMKDAWELAFAAGGKEGAARAIIGDVVRNPVTALFAGILATSLIQSSSATIAIAIAMVSAGGLTVAAAVPLVMGANIGTTITNTLVSLAHVFRKKEFATVVPAAIVDDLFKVLNVTLFFILEMLTGVLSKSAAILSQFMGELPLFGFFLSSFPDFVDIIVDPVVGPAVGIIVEVFGRNTTGAIALGILSFAVLVYGLKMMSDSIRQLVEPHADSILKRAFKSPPRSTAVGFSLCWLLQSSSVTTSLIIPFVAADVIKLKQVYHYSLGAAIGTTCDAGQIVSYIKFGVLGLSVGLVHVLLNVFGVIIFSTVPVLKDIPVRLAEMIGDTITKSRGGALMLIAYTVTIFYIVPLVIILWWG